MTIKLKWGIDNGKEQHAVGDEVSLTKNEEKELVDGGFASYVGGLIKSAPKAEVKPQSKVGDKDEP